MAQFDVNSTSIENIISSIKAGEIAILSDHLDTVQILKTDLLFSMASYSTEP